MTAAELIAKAQCKLFGHKRGKRVGEATDIINGMRNYYCPRCKVRWTRKAKKAKA